MLQKIEIRIKSIRWEKSQYTNREHQVDLLLFSASCDDGHKTQHYCVIKNMSKLLSSQKSKDGHVRHYCRNCLNSFTSKERLTVHEDMCKMHEVYKIEMPKEGSTQYFKNYHRSQSVPFEVYADFECFTKPIHTCQPNPKPDSYTKKYQKH